MSVYLDYNASAPISPEVLQCMLNIYQNHTGNADSRTHDYGEDARSLVEAARGQVASLLGVKRNEVFFTSGATESNNIAVLGLKEHGVKSGRKHLVTTAIEHKAVLGAMRHLEHEGFELDVVNPDSDGRISAANILSKVRDDTLLVSVMHVNNETGMIQPVDEIGQALSKTETLFHIDATQSVGKLVPEIRALPYDLMSISGHKIHAPQGIGALVLRRKRYQLPPVSSIMFGGAQEHGIRPGTLPTALIAGLGTACEIAERNYEPNQRHNMHLKSKLLELLSSSGAVYQLNGCLEHCVPTTLNVSFCGISSEALMLAVKPYCGISNGSACNSASYQHSYVLSAMGLSSERIESAVRISWDADIQEEAFFREISNMLNVVRSFTPEAVRKSGA